MMGDTGRRKKGAFNWKSDLFIKFMVSVSVAFIVASYNKLTDFVIESSTFKGQMLEFKTNTEKEIKQLIKNDKTFGDEQKKRTENVYFSGKLKEGDTETVNKLCKQIIEGKCE